MIEDRAASETTASLSRRTLDAFAWRLLSETSKLVLQLVVQVTLARLLPVEAFGMLAIATLVVNFGTRVSEVGTAQALIQRASLNDLHVRIGFTLSMFFGAFVTLAIWLGAPFAASAFHAGAVTPVLRLIGFVFVLGSVGNTAEALLQRRMDYRRLLSVELISYAVGYAGVGIGLALMGWGIWALAWATLVQATLRSVLLVGAAPHPMRPSLAGAEARQLLNFGIGTTLARLASFAAQNADYFVVARWLGTTALGWYSRAYQLMCLPIYQFSSILNVVLFPAYSSIQTDAERLRRGYLGSLCLSALVVFPALTMLGIFAPEVMSGVFGRQWAPAAVPLQILCVAGAGYCTYNLGDSLVRARGAVYRKFLYQSIYAVAVAGAALVGSRWNITGVAAGVVTATVVVYVLMADLSLRLTAARWRQFWLAQSPGVAVSAAVLGVGLPVAMALRDRGLDPIAVLAIGGMTCVVVMSAAAAALPDVWLSPGVRELVASGRAYARKTIARWPNAVGWLRNEA